MKYTLLIASLLFNSAFYSQLLFKVSADTLSAFNYSGGDEFSGIEVNKTYWKGPWTRINMAQDFRYNDENIKLENGVINFVMEKKDSLYTIQPHEVDSSFLKEQKITIQDQQYLLHYSAGMIITQQKVHYGLYELRFKVEEGKGVWPAFWFYGGNKNEEIDAFELKGERNNEIHVDTHCPEGCGSGYKNKLGFKTSYGGWMKISDYLHTGYNILFLDWREGEIIWYINGYPLAYFKGDFPNPMNLFLNTQIAADGRAFKPGPDKNTNFPNNFYVDYLRIWKKSSSDTLLTLSPNSYLTTSDKFIGNYQTKASRKTGLMYKRKKLNKEEGIVSLLLNQPGKMTVTVFGNIATPSTTISIIGKNTNYEIKDFSKENELFLSAGESEMELLIKSEDKELRRKFKINANQ